MTPEALDALIEAGATIEMIASAWKAEMRAAKPPRSKGAERQERYRERHKASQSVTSDDETSQRNITPSLSPSLPPDPQPNPIPTPGNNPTRKGTRLSENWEPDPVIGNAETMVAGWPPGAIDREMAKFRNYWIAKSGKDAVKANWQRTWINWLISADERIGRNGLGKSSGGSAGRADHFTNELIRMGKGET